MTPASCKNKGRLLQQWVRDKLLALYPELQEGDIRSTSMGAGGEDVQLSPAARSVFNFKIECKSLAASAVYKLFEQATSHKAPGEALLILKANRKRPLAVLDAEAFFQLVRRDGNKDVS